MAKEVEQTPLKKGRSTFTLVGKVNKINDFTFDLGKKAKSGWTSNRLNLGVDASKGNIVYAELQGGYDGAENAKDSKTVIYAHGKDKDGKDDYKTQIIVSWADRFNEKVLETIADSCFITIGIEKTSDGKTFIKKFLSEYDAVEYVQQHLVEGTVVNVKGQLQYSYFNEKTIIKKNIKSIFLSSADSEDKYKATFTQTILLDSDSVGDLDKEKNTYEVDAYVVDYVGKVNGQEIKKNCSFAIPLEIDNNTEKPDAAKLFIKAFFKPKAGKLNELAVEGEFFEGAATTTITLKDLPEDIQNMVAIGFLNAEEVIGKAAGVGAREKRMIIKKPLVIATGSEEEGTRTTTIVYDNDKYVEDDLLPVQSLVNENAVEEIVKEAKEEQKEEAKAEQKSNNGDNWEALLGGLGL